VVSIHQALVLPRVISVLVVKSQQVQGVYYVMQGNSQSLVVHAKSALMEHTPPQRVHAHAPPALLAVARMLMELDV
jgi:hypothetical protein